ncbi:MAG TPA: hypothetical protein VE620_05245 [Myxococcales bacterium]|jgi:hypothetical protein|nr:hypothetical protein [Myxococcales bacterium]
MRRLFPIVALCLAAAGCEPAWSVQGHAQDAGNAAVAASAVLRCPGEADRLAHADADGVFELGGTGAGPSLDCAVIVSAPGRASVLVPLRDACEDPVGERCSVAMVEVQLLAAR